MKIIEAGYETITPINGKIIFQRIERIARTCYKSEDKINDGSAEKMISALIRRGHEAMLEHCSFTVKFIVDRGVSHELVRHRMASFAQESTRYCNYSKDGFGSEITVIKPCFFEEGTEKYKHWVCAMQDAESYYFHLLKCGCTPQEARSVLPNSLKTEVCMTADLREWRHFFKLRAADASGAAHPQMKEVTVPLLAELKTLIPIVFDDIVV
jgi:thymidylate synthase (FAD)